MQYDYLEAFLNHEIVINIKNAIKADLEELDKVIGLAYQDGSRLYEKRVINENRYLHCRVRIGDWDGMSYSSRPVDMYNAMQLMPVVDFRTFLDSGKVQDISENELEKLFIEDYIENSNELDEESVVIENGCK